jgi:hypothetical protein
VLTGIAGDDNTGIFVSAAGDVNGDGIGDLIISATGADPDDLRDAGSTYVVFGRDTPQAGNFPAVFPLADLESGDGSAGFILAGVDRDDAAGCLRSRSSAACAAAGGSR